MDNESKIPEGWAMPDDLAKKVSEFMNQKAASSPLTDLMEVIKETANDIADVEPEPSDWAGWITYLMEALQGEAKKDFKCADFEKMLVTLRDDLIIRIDGGNW